MKKILSALILTACLAPVCFISAAPTDPGVVAPEIIKTGAEFVGLINTIGNWIFFILLAIAVIFLIIAGLMFVLAGGNPENITKARQMLISALIGVAVALAARGLVAVISSILGYNPGS
jgi:magnesium-transporting ATPase (P-type)